jgi:transposase-like protein
MDACLCPKCKRACGMFKIMPYKHEDDPESSKPRWMCKTCWDNLSNETKDAFLVPDKNVLGRIQMRIWGDDELS